MGYNFRVYSSMIEHFALNDVDNDLNPFAKLFGLVVQLVETLVLKTKGCGFEFHQDY